jgi:hypothetical protein
MPPSCRALIVFRSGPNCCAWSLYEVKEECEDCVGLVKDSGSDRVGEAGCGCGLWSTEAGDRLVGDGTCARTAEVRTWCSPSADEFDGGSALNLVCCLAQCPGEADHGRLSKLVGVCETPRPLFAMAVGRSTV